MDIRVLQYFLVIAREENITRASQVLHVTQPTLSRQLMQLENELGVKLFNRSNHNIFLTDEGLHFRRRAQEIVSLAERTRQELNQKNQISGDIMVGSGELQGFSSLAKMLTDFQKENPLVHFDIYSGNADQIKERIENGLLDIGLLLMPVDIGKYDFIELPGEEIYGAYVYKDHPLARKKSIMAEDLLHEKLIMPQRLNVQNLISAWFDENYDSLNIIGTSNLLGNAARLAQQKAGIVISLKLNCDYHDLRFIPLVPQLKGRTILVWKKNQLLFPTVEAFVKFSKTCNSCIEDHEK